MTEGTEETPPPTTEEQIEEIDDAITELFSEIEARIEALAGELAALREEVATSGKSLVEHADRYEHTERKVRDAAPGERHFYFKRVGN